MSERCRVKENKSVESKHNRVCLVAGLACRVYDIGYWVECVECRVYGVGYGMECVECRVRETSRV